MNKLQANSETISELQSYRAELASIEERMMQMPQQKGVKVTEMILGGIYVRNLFIPKGSILTGMIHKKDCINILASGVIQVWTESEGILTIKGFEMFKSNAGSKRIGRTWTDVHWVNVFPVDEGVELDDMVAHVATMDYEDPLIEYDDKERLQ